jgi:hypothetical protein
LDWQPTSGPVLVGLGVDVAVVEGEIEALGVLVDGDDEGTTDGLVVGVELADDEGLADGVPPGMSQSSTKPPDALSVLTQVRPWAAAAAAARELASAGC